MLFLLEERAAAAGEKRTDGVELDALVPELLGAEDDLVLGLSVSDEHADLARVRTHPHVDLEVVLQDEVQRHACEHTRARGLAVRR